MPSLAYSLALLAYTTVAARPAAHPTPFKISSFSLSQSWSTCTCSFRIKYSSCFHNSLATQIEGLEVVRDKCRYQFIMMQFSSSSWIPANSCSTALHIHLPFPIAWLLTSDPTPKQKQQPYMQRLTGLRSCERSIPTNKSLILCLHHLFTALLKPNSFCSMTNGTAQRVQYNKVLDL